MSLNNRIFPLIEPTDTFKQWADKCNDLFDTVNEIEIPLIQDVVGINNTQNIFGIKTFISDTNFAGGTFTGLSNSLNVLTGTFTVGDAVNPTTTITNFFDPNINFQKSSLDPSLLLSFKDGDTSTLLLENGNLELSVGDFTIGGLLSSNGFSIDASSNLNIDGIINFGTLGSQLGDTVGLTINGGDIETTSGSLTVTESVNWGGGLLGSNGNVRFDGPQINLKTNSPSLYFEDLGYAWDIPTSKPLADSILKWDITTDKLAWQLQTDLEADVEAAVSASLTSANFSLPIQLNPVGTLIEVDANILDNWNQADEGNGNTYIEDPEYDTWLVPDGVKVVSYDTTTGLPEDEKYEKLVHLLKPSSVGNTSDSATLPNYLTSSQLSTDTVYLIKASEDRVVTYNLYNEGGSAGSNGIRLLDSSNTLTNKIDINGGKIGLNLDNDRLNFITGGKLSVRSTYDPDFAAAQTGANGWVARYTSGGRLRTKWPVEYNDAVSLSFLENELDTINNTVTTLETDVNAALAQTLSDVEAENLVLLDRINEFENKGHVWKFPARDGTLVLDETGDSLTYGDDRRYWGTSMNRGLSPEAMYIGTDRRAYFHGDYYDYGTQNYSNGEPIAALSPITGTWARFKEIVQLGHRHMVIDEDDIVYVFGVSTQWYGLRGADAVVNPQNSWTTKGSGVTNANLADHIPSPGMVPNATGVDSPGQCTFIRAKQVAFSVYPSGDDWWRRNGCHIITKDGYDLDDTLSFTGDGTDNGTNKPLHRGRCISGGQLNSGSWYGRSGSGGTEAKGSTGPTLWSNATNTIGSTLWYVYGNAVEKDQNGNINRVRTPDFKSFNWYTPDNPNYEDNDSNAWEYGGNKWYVKYIHQSGFDNFVIVGHPDNDTDNETWAWGNNDFDQAGNIAWRGNNADSMVPVLDHQNLLQLDTPIMNDGGNTRIFRRTDSQPHGLKDFDAIKMPNNYWYFVITGDGNNERKQTRFRVYDYQSQRIIVNGLFPATPGTTNASSFTLSSTSTFQPQYYTRLKGLVKIQGDYPGSSHNYSSIFAQQDDGDILGPTNRNYTTWSWGYNANGQCAHGTTTTKAFPKKTGTSFSDQIYPAGNGFFLRKNKQLWFSGYQNNTGGYGFKHVIDSTNTTTKVSTLTKCTISDAGNNALRKFFIVPWRGGSGHQQFAVTQTDAQIANGEEAVLYASGYNYYHDVGWHLGSAREGYDGSGTYTNGWRRIYFPEDPMNIVEIGGVRDHITFILCKDNGDPLAEKGRVYVAGYLGNSQAWDIENFIAPVFRSAQKMFQRSYD